MLQTSTAAPHAHMSMSCGQTAKPLCYVIGKDKPKFAFYQILSRFSKQEHVAKLLHAASLDKVSEGEGAITRGQTEQYAVLQRAIVLQ